MKFGKKWIDTAKILPHRHSRIIEIHIDHLCESKPGDTFEWCVFTFEKKVDMDGQRIDKVIVNITDEIREEMD